MQVREQNLPGLEHFALGRLGLLDLHHEIALGKHVGGCLHDGGAGCTVLRVVHPDSAPSPRLDDDLVPGCDQLSDTCRHETHPVLVNLDFPRDTDTHRSTP